MRERPLKLTFQRSELENSELSKTDTQTSPGSPASPAAPAKALGGGVGRGTDGHPDLQCPAFLVGAPFKIKDRKEECTGVG